MVWYCYHCNFIVLKYNYALQVCGVQRGNSVGYCVVCWDITDFLCCLLVCVLLRWEGQSADVHLWWEGSSIEHQKTRDKHGWRFHFDYQLGIFSLFSPPTSPPHPITFALWLIKKKRKEKKSFFFNISLNYCCDFFCCYWIKITFEPVMSLCLVGVGGNWLGNGVHETFSVSYQKCVT